MKTVKSFDLNIYTIVITNMLWGFVNFIYMIQIQPFILSIYGTTPKATQILGLLLTLGSLSAVIPLLMGFLADFYGRKKMVLLGQALSIIGLLGLSFSATDVVLLLTSIILFNFGIGLYEAPLQGLIYESATDNRGLAFSIVYNFSYLAGIVASLLIQEGNIEIVIFFQIGVILIAISLISNLVLRDLLPNRKTINFPIVKIFSEPLSRLTALTFAADAFIWGLPLSIANGIFIIVLDVNLSFIATLTLFETIVMVILASPAGIFVDRFGRIAGLIVGEILGFFWIVAVLIALISPDMTPDAVSNLLIIGYAFLGAVVAFWRPSVTLSFISIDPDSAATSFGILAFFQRLGRVPAAVVAGFLFPLIGFPPLLFITFFGTLIIIGFFYKMDKIDKTNIAINKLSESLESSKN